MRFIRQFLLCLRLHKADGLRCRVTNELRWNCHHRLSYPAPTLRNKCRQAWFGG